MSVVVINANPEGFPVPIELTAPELGEWLDGAGFSLNASFPTSTGPIDWYTVRVETNGWPVAVAVRADGDVVRRVVVHYAEAAVNA